MRFYLLRHGQTEWNIAGKIQGKTDIPLNETGLFQAECLAEGMKDKTLCAVYSSPLLRARQTAELLAEKKGLSVQVLPELCEVDFGLWEGKGWAEIEEQFPEDFRNWERDPAGHMPTGGESKDTCQKRCQLAVEQMQKEIEAMDASGTEDLAAAIVAHGGILAHLARYLFRNQSERQEIIVKNASISVIDYDPRTELGKLIVLNDTSHLKADSSGKTNKFC